jgi:hypothetical protein
MVIVDHCDKSTIASLMQAISKAALGHPIAFEFEGGVHRRRDGGRLFEMPNGTVTFRLFVNGGAKDSGEPPKPKDVPLREGEEELIY